MPHLVISHDKAERKAGFLLSVNVKIIDIIPDGACPPLLHAGARVV